MPIQQEASDHRGRRIAELNRRRALQLLAGGMAFTLSSCGPPDEEVVPYVEQPERLTPGNPLAFATTLSLAGYGRGVLATSYEGRPTRIDGNPKHPASLGAADVFDQSAVMSLYDPDRSKTVLKAGQISSWGLFSQAMIAQLEAEKTRHGAGLRILTERITSPSVLRQLHAVLDAFPEARWVRYDPVHDDQARAGAELAFGSYLTPLPRIAESRVILALDADPLGPGPEQIRLGNAFAKVRRPPNDFLRLYVAESAWHLTGANADERLAIVPQLMANIAIAVANRFGANLPEGEIPDQARKFAAAAADDLAANPGNAMVLAGRGQSAEVHALCHWVNDQLRAPIDYIAPIDPVNEPHGASLRSLMADLSNHSVQTLIVLGSNPVYATPGDLAIGEAIAAVPFSLHLGLHSDETAEHCTWHLPLSHALESWSDLRAYDGTASIVQPLIRPLYDTRTAHHLLGILQGSVSVSAYDVVRETWRGQKGAADFESNWRRWLHDGVVEGTAEAAVKTPAPKLPDIKPAGRPSGLALVLAPDPSIWDGSCCNNAWLQECAKPISKQVWGNALHLSPADASARKLSDGDMVEMSSGATSIEAMVHVEKGQAQGALAATLGYGRHRAGAIGTGIGFNVYPLRSLDSPWLIPDVKIAATGRKRQFLETQHFFELEAEDRDILRTVSLADLHHIQAVSPQSEQEHPTLLPEWGYKDHKWAMVIDTSVCIGCNACVIACQAENNVPIVGPDEIAVGRDMHWLRVDTYFDDKSDRLLGFQPVPCMHCEHAPCEPVCPVEASVHDGEGLNVQVYNRCVGTRFCQSNCPYKVRRFNFFGYSYEEPYANQGDEVIKAHFNPDVTVRARGVMEKCTYCVQRISRARRESEKTDQPIPDGGVVTACQAACPTAAISFGDLNNRGSRVNALRREAHHYAMLDHLGTRPRTTYLARIVNGNPKLDGDET